MISTTCQCCGSEIEREGVRKFCSDRCRQKSFYHAFKARTGLRYKLVPHAPRVKPKRRIKRRPWSNTKLQVAVKEIRIRDEPYIRVTFGKDGSRRNKSFSVRKLGLENAKLAASLLRLSWLVEAGVWKQEHGDPFAIMSYAESFKGNHEYEHTTVTDVSSPWIPEREDD